MRALSVIVLAAIACGSPQRAPLGGAGSDHDEGAGQLARASLSLETGETEREDGFRDDRPLRGYGYEYGGDSYGGNGYGGDAYGGASYAGWRTPQWRYAAPNRTPRYQVSGGLTGAIEGTVTWNGQLPPKLTTPCGVIENPTFHVSSDKHVRGVVVYIEKVAIGRVTPYYSRPAGVGGTITRRGCALAPAAQIVTPLPASVTIHGDTQRTKLRVAPPTGSAVASELQEGGFVQVEVKPGITRVDGDDGKVAAAWVIGLDSPYYAITDDLGRYRLDELAPGNYEVTFWQPPVASLARDGTWSYGSPLVVRRSVRVERKTVPLSVSLPTR